MRIRPFRALLILPMLACCHFAAAAEPRSFSITDFGANGDGKALNTQAIAKTIDAASKAGGGIVRVPGGKWLTGPVNLKSNITLELDENATLLMSTNPADYPVVLTRWDGVECYNFSPMIGARDASNVGITGKGTIDAQGHAWWHWVKSAGPARARLRELAESVTGPHERIFGNVNDALRPSMVQFFNCKKVLIEQITLRNSPMWTVHPIYCEDFTCREVKVFNKGPNTDGFDIDSCKGVLLEKCEVECDEDCIALKSGRNADGRRVAKPSENVTVRDCKFKRGYAGIAIGSEMSGGIKGLTVSHCEFDGVQRGFRIKTMRGRGGVIEALQLTDLKMKNISEAAIEIDMQYNPTPNKDLDETTPVIRDLIFENIDVESGKQAVFIRGLLESPIDGLTIKKSKFKTDRGLSAQYSERIKLEEVELAAKDGPPIQVERAVEWTIDKVKFTGQAKNEQIELKHTARMTIQNTNPRDGASAFLKISGKESSEIKLINCDTSKAKRRTDIAADVPKDAVQE